MEGLNKRTKDYQITVNNRFQSFKFFNTMFVSENQCLQCCWKTKNLRDSGFGIRDFHKKKGSEIQDSGLKECTGWGMPKIIIGITGLRVNLSRDGEI